MRRDDRSLARRVRNGEPARASHAPRLALEQRALALDTPAVARERAVVADDAMARNGDRERVRRAGLRHGAHRLGAPMRAAISRVARRRAGRDLAQRLPHPLLESGAAHVERQVQAQRRALRRSRRPWRPAARTARRRRSSRASGKRSCRSRSKRLGIVAEQDGADALGGGGDQDRAERAFADREADRRAPRRRRESCDGVMPSTSVGLRVEAAVGVEAGVVDRLGHGAVLRRARRARAARDAPPRRPSASGP